MSNKTRIKPTQNSFRVTRPQTKLFYFNFTTHVRIFLRLPVSSSVAYIHNLYSQKCSKKTKNTVEQVKSSLKANYTACGNHAHKNAQKNSCDVSCDVELWSIGHAKFHRAKCSGSWVIEVTEKKNFATMLKIILPSLPRGVTNIHSNKTDAQTDTKTENIAYIGRKSH